MPAPSEQKTVQARILAYAGEIGWRYVSRGEAEERRGFDPDGATPEDRARTASLYFGDLLHAQVRAFNPKYKEAQGALVGEFARLNADIAGNRDFLTYLRNQGKLFCAEENRELDLMLIDYGDFARQREAWRNVYEVTEEFYVHNGRYGTREDVVFLINGIPVLVIECKNASKDEAIALAVDQLRRYHAETPEVMVPEMIFTATEAIGFAYGVTWNTVRRNILSWKHEEAGNLEAKVKSFCEVKQVLRFLKDFILFAEKEEELQKFVLRQHQMGGADRVVARALDPQRSRGLVWHTQGSGKTYTMIKASEMLFKAPEAEKPTILLMIDRNELEDQMLKNLASVGLGNVAHANSIAVLNRLLREDYRGIIVTMIHKFRDMPANLNLRKNIYVLIDEAHRTTGGDLGNFLMAGLPNATFIGFTGTPVDKTVYGQSNRYRRGPLHPAAKEFSPMSAWSDKKEFKARVLEWAAKLGVKAGAMHVRPMRRKWASCSTTGTLSFNDEILGLDRELGDYVIVHELLHFSVPNHGRLWKSLMRAHLGDYEKLEARLKRSSRHDFYMSSTL